MPSNFSWTDFFVDAGIPPSVSAEYALVFADHRMQASMVPDLTKDVLHDLGITVMGDILAILRQSKIYMQTERRRQQAGVSVSQQMLSSSRNVQPVPASQPAAVVKPQQQKQPQRNLQTVAKSSTAAQASAKSSASLQSPRVVAKSAQSVPKPLPTSSDSEASTWLRSDILSRTGVRASQGAVTSAASSLTDAPPKRRIVTRPRAVIGTELPESHMESNRNQTTVIRQASEPDSVFKRLGLNQSAAVQSGQLQQKRSIVRSANSQAQSISGLGTVLVKNEPVAAKRTLSQTTLGTRGHVQATQRTVATTAATTQTASRPMIMRTVALLSDDCVEELPDHGMAVTRQVRTGVLQPSASEPLPKRVYFDEDSVRKFTVQTNGSGTSAARSVSQVDVNSSVTVLHKLGDSQRDDSQSLMTKSVRQKQLAKSNVKARLGTTKSVFSRLG